MLLIDPLCKRQILVWLILVCCQGCCFMLQGKSLGGAEAGLAGGTDKLRDASALLTEHGMLPSWKEGGMNWLRSSDIFPLFAIPLLVLDFQRSKKMVVRYQVLDISSLTGH